MDAFPYFAPLESTADEVINHPYLNSRYFVPTMLKYVE
jgi:hypothetical protein